MFVSSLDWASHKIVKHYANSNLARIVSVTKSSPRSPTLQFQMSISRYNLTENYLTIWAWSKMGWGGWRVESDQSATKRVQSAAWQPGLCDWGQWGESVSPCCLSAQVWDPLPPVRRPPAVWLIYCTSNNRLKQIKPTATVVTPPRAGLWTPVVFINNSIQSLGSRGQCMLSRWDEASEIQQRPPGLRYSNMVNICWPGALMTSGPDIVSWGLRHMMGAWHWHRGPGDGRGKEGVSPIRSGGSQGGRSDAGEVSCQYWESQPQVAITHSGALSAIYRIVCVWYEESPPSPILSFEDWVSIMTCITQTLSWHGQVADKASCHPDMDKGDNYSAWVWLLQLHPTIHITIYRARTHTRQIRARLVGCEGWLGLDGRPSLHRPYGVTHTRCAPAPLWPISP